MKKNLLFTFILFVLSGFCVSAQVYHEDDKEGLRQFLMQPSTENGKLNLEYLGLDVSDTQNWYTSEDWVEKIKMGLYWGDGFSTAKRLMMIHLVGEEAKKISGHFDGRKFSYIQEVFIDDANIESINMSGIRFLRLSVNGLLNVRSIDVSYCSSLGILELDFGVLSKDGFIMPGGVLERLNMYNCESLLWFSLKQSDISDLNLPPSIEHLRLMGNQFIEPDFSLLPNLTELILQNNLTSIDLSSLSQLTGLHCDENQLASLDLSKNNKLEILDCSSNKLTRLDLSNLSQLKEIYCRYNQLTNLDLSNQNQLTQLSCEGNQLTSLDLLNLSLLKYLSCSGNQLTNLDFSNISQLYFLGCSGNELASLDLSNLSLLRYLSCGGNQLVNIDFPNIGNLTHVDVSDNQLVNLDLSNQKQLVNLRCNHNQLTSLDLSNLNQLEDLLCHYNKLSSLNTSNTKLKFAICNNNNLRFSTMKGVGYVRSYTPQAHMQGGDIMAGSDIDISSEYTISNEYTSAITTYQWYDKSYAPITLPMKAGGVFVADAAYTGDLLTCEMKNALFPELTLYYKVKVTEAGVALADHLKFNNPDAEYTYSVAPERNFKVYAKTTVNPADVRLGLYNPSTASYNGQTAAEGRGC